MGLVDKLKRTGAVVAAAAILSTTPVYSGEVNDSLLNLWESAKDCGKVIVKKLTEETKDQKFLRYIREYPYKKNSYNLGVIHNGIEDPLKLKPYIETELGSLQGYPFNIIKQDSLMTLVSNWGIGTDYFVRNPMYYYPGMQENNVDGVLIYGYYAENKVEIPETDLGVRKVRFSMRYYHMDGDTIVKQSWDTTDLNIESTVKKLADLIGNNGIKGSEGVHVKVLRRLSEEYDGN